MVDYSIETYEADLKLCNAMIKRCFSKYKNEVEDLRQVGLMAQVRGREKYELSEKAKLSTYLWTCTYISMLDYLRHNCLKNETHSNLSLNTLLPTRDGNVTLEDIIEDTFSFDDIDDSIVIIDTIKKYFKEYENKSSNAYRIAKYTILGYSSREIMEKLGISVSYINRVKQEFLAKLKIMLDKELHSYDR